MRRSPPGSRRLTPTAHGGLRPLHTRDTQAMRWAGAQDRAGREECDFVTPGNSPQPTFHPQNRSTNSRIPGRSPTPCEVPPRAGGGFALSPLPAGARSHRAARPRGAEPRLSTTSPPRPLAPGLVASSVGNWGAGVSGCGLVRGGPGCGRLWEGRPHSPRGGSAAKTASPSWAPRASSGPGPGPGGPRPPGPTGGDCGPHSSVPRALAQGLFLRRLTQLGAAGRAGVQVSGNRSFCFLV